MKQRIEQFWRFIINFFFFSFKETARRLLTFIFDIETLHRVCAAIEYTTCISLVRIDVNLNADRYISDTLRAMAVPYLRDLCQASSINKIM